MAKKKYIWMAGIVLLVVALFFVFSGSKTSSYAALDNFEGDIIIYKSTSCGCCSVYGDYFKVQGSSNAKIITIEEINSIKTQYGIPKELESCHTTIVGDYFVEGHVPLKAVNKLIEEKPEIAGIAMPGMPSGSPGMPGAKTGDFVVYAINYDGSYEEFMRL